MPTHQKLVLRNPPLAALLSWLVPGLGHAYQGRVGKGILFFCCVMGLFLLGCQMGAWQVVYFRWDSEERRWPYLAQLGVGVVALPALLHEPRHHGGGFEAPPTDKEIDMLHHRYGKRMDIAVVYTMIAGLLNLLVVYDALAGPALHDEELKFLAIAKSAGGEPPTA